MNNAASIDDTHSKTCEKEDFKEITMWKYFGKVLLLKFFMVSRTHAII